MLPNGNILYIEDPKGVVTEVTPDQQVVWQYKTAGASLVSAQRLPNGNTLLVDDVSTKLFEVTSAGAIVWSIEKPEWKGLAMRRARRTASGSTLLAIQKAGLIVELDPAGRILRRLELPNRMPAHALPTADGGMWIGLAGPGEVRRVSAEGKLLATFGGLDPAARMAWTSGFTPTADGGLLVADYMGSRIVEFNAAGQIVHQLKNLPWAMTSVGMLPIAASK